MIPYNIYMATVYILLYCQDNYGGYYVYSSLFLSCIYFYYLFSYFCFCPTEFFLVSFIDYGANIQRLFSLSHVNNFYTFPYSSIFLHSFYPSYYLFWMTSNSLDEHLHRLQWMYYLRLLTVLLQER